MGCGEEYSRMEFVDSEDVEGGKGMGILGSRAVDINVSEEDFCMILGYVAAPGRVGFIEAQIPEDRVWEFENCYPDQEYYPITQGETSGGNTMKQGCQFRIYFNNIRNCPAVLLPYIGEGNLAYCKRINKGRFIEKIVEHYGFQFGHYQDAMQIRRRVHDRYPEYIDRFDYGYNL